MNITNLIKILIVNVSKWWFVQLNILYMSKLNLILKSLSLHNWFRIPFIVLLNKWFQHYNDVSQNLHMVITNTILDITWPCFSWLLKGVTTVGTCTPWTIGSATFHSWTITISKSILTSGSTGRWACVPLFPCSPTTIN